MLAGAAAFAGCSAKVSDRDLRELPPGEVAERLREDPDRYAVIDARSQEAFDAGHLPGARRLALQDVEDAAEDLSRYRAVIVYGDDPGSPRPAAIAKRLMQAGVDVYLLRAGYDGWTAAALPTRKPGGERSE